MDRDQIVDRIAHAIRMQQAVQTTSFPATPDRLADAAISAIESSGYVIMPKDKILRKMSKDEFSELMAGVKFKEPSDV